MLEMYARVAELIDRRADTNEIETAYQKLKAEQKSETKRLARVLSTKVELEDYPLRTVDYLVAQSEKVHLNCPIMAKLRECDLIANALIDREVTFHKAYRQGKISRLELALELDHINSKWRELTRVEVEIGKKVTYVE